MRLRLLPNKMAIVLLFAILTVAGLANGRNFNLQNNMGYPVWVGILGNAGKGQPDNGGFALNPGQRVSKGQESSGVELVCQWEEITLKLLGKMNYRFTLRHLTIIIIYLLLNFSSFTAKQ